MTKFERMFLLLDALHAQQARQRPHEWAVLAPRQFIGKPPKHHTCACTCACACTCTCACAYMHMCMCMSCLHLHMELSDPPPPPTRQPLSRGEHLPVKL